MRKNQHHFIGYLQVDQDKLFDERKKTKVKNLMGLSLKKIRRLSYPHNTELTCLLNISTSSQTIKMHSGYKSGDLKEYIA